MSACGCSARCDPPQSTWHPKSSDPRSAPSQPPATRYSDDGQRSANSRDRSALRLRQLEAAKASPHLNFFKAAGIPAVEVELPSRLAVI